MATSRTPNILNPRVIPQSTPPLNSYPTRADGYPLSSLVILCFVQHPDAGVAGWFFSLGATMTHAKSILFSVVALVVGGLIGAWLGRSNMSGGERKREPINTYATTMFLSEQIELLNRSDTEKAKVNWRSNCSPKPPLIL